MRQDRNGVDDVPEAGFYSPPLTTVRQDFATVGRTSVEMLIARVEDYRAKFAGSPVPRPPHWGGYRVIPTRIEFWQGGPGRLHDRFVYLLKNDKWSFTRLNP